MRLYRSALDLALLSLVFMSGGIILPYWNRDQSPAHWFLSMAAGLTLVLVSVVLSILSIQVRAGWHKGPEPRGVRLGRRTLGAGFLLTAVGVLSMILLIQCGDRLAPAVGVLALKLSPILIALGTVIIRSSTLALRTEESDSLGILTLGNATYRTGVILCWMALLALGGFMLGMIVPKIRWKVGFLFIFIVIDCLPAGLALIALGKWIQTDAQPTEHATVGSVP